ncbi:MAG: tRNA pseudouridine(38-40) synthase TruA [Candidatus Caccosoma sp.]|nr:tRNA pseudouridine(38-40) synthase TruA [Candidatus Caccosoma sp.]
MKYKCIVSYDGYSFNGYQKQKHDKNTIQEVIENTLSTIFKEKIIIYGSGRTDKQVHAYGQVFHFESLIKIPLSNLKKALNEMLPIAIRIKKIESVSDLFHARYSSHKKVYVYKIKNTKNENVFDNRYYTYIKDKIDIIKLKEASQLFIGRHNFKNFTTNKEEEIESFEKTIYEINVKKVKNTVEIEFYGSGFLRYQIRMMVGALLVVATNKKDISFIANKLLNNVDEKCSYKAPPQGLYLKKVIY